MDSPPPSRPLYARPWFLAPCAVIFSAALIAILLVAIRGRLSPVLASWTGEEDYPEQLKGTISLLSLRLTRPRPETQPYVPIAHAGVNPFGINTFLEQEVEPEKVKESNKVYDRETGSLTKWFKATHLAQGENRMDDEDREALKSLGYIQ